MENVKKDYNSFSKKDVNENRNNRFHKENKSAIGDYDRKSVIASNSFISYN